MSKFTIKNITMIGMESLILPKNTDCTICRCDLNSVSIYKSKNINNLDSIISTGKCDHSFHNECIKLWLIQNKICPICAVVWENKNPITEL
uniref:RING-type domain-containing protein n=1 Tax=viral metagenome TaxID=1070528 RepID=A0A6C0H8B3_9ZZZZ